ncbi:hypothetical protein [Mesorhizobium sp. B2-7-1]|uniref:hypothetical protein n=1 Tax=Mesorhizobium sp. B2-7-1 TaxID=2589909 RepID=UPI001129B7D8|nr:hypothetical protein [Mesorhizobium sp. B2-7-1]TPJ44454.1 hypothetical protein FJ471_32870 [Mesorhizobium sp. B2-7-1]
MKWWLILVVVAGSVGSGLVAAYKWWKASQVEVRPFDEWGREIPTSDSFAWINAVRGTLAKSGAKNKEAAIWTAVSVALAGLSSLANLPSN